MHWAAKRGQVDIIQVLYDAGAPFDIKAKEDPGMYPIHWAAAEGNLDAIDFFLSKGVDINILDSNGCSPAVIAAQFKQLTALVYLWKRGADVALKDHNGDHCLHWAAYNGHDEIVHFALFMMPGEINCSDNFGQVIHRQVLSLK